MWRGTRKYQLGFSLVELMAVIAIISILVSLALPRFRLFVARGRQAEAMHNLGNIKGLQHAFNLRKQGLNLGDNLYHTGMVMGEGDDLATGHTCAETLIGIKNDLGFRVEDCPKLRYTYVSNNLAGSVGEATNNANGGKFIYPNCSGSRDEWVISMSGAITNDDVVRHCDD